MDMFDRLAPYIQDYIYSENWDELRQIQVASCDVIFNSNDNLLLTSGTASGKTEAAFLPTLTKLYENKSSSVGILYISPLKALINDQFYRLNYLLEEGNVPVCKWHGDSLQSAKKRMMKNPQGVLQITPESLESLLINKKDLCFSLFRDLRFIIIDEVHYFMASQRGLQLLCQLEKIQRLTKNIPRRIGLSATLGDNSLAEKWLNSSTNRRCRTPIEEAEKRKIGISMQLFTKSGDDSTDKIDSGDRENFEYLYQHTLGKKAIIFANSRANVEFTMSNIKAIAEQNNTPDIYRVHHGNISSVLREDIEQEMKHSTSSIVTGSTVTLELGIDIGNLDRIAQIGAPFSVSSFTQRLGRCGRRGQSAELIFTFLQEKNAVGFFAEINWNFLRGIAILQLYLEERWVEPIEIPHFSYSLLYHQTMSYLTSNGEVLPSILAQNILTLSVFKNISQDDYKILLRHLIEIQHIEKTERGGLIVGIKGERIVNNYEFFSVFESRVEYTVKCENKTIGTIQNPVPVGEQFTLAGHSWETIEIDDTSRTIFVKFIHGIAKSNWIDFSDMEIHTKVLQKMREILLSNKSYAYMSDSCKEKLASMRKFAEHTKFANKLVTKLSPNRYAVVPFVGTKQICALKYALESYGYGVEERGYFLIIQTLQSEKDITKDIHNIICTTIDKYDFDLPYYIQIPHKYNAYIPDELLEKEYIEDFIDLDGLKESLCENLSI